MAVEAKRGCGYRKVGGLYVVTDPGFAFECRKLPYYLHVCSVCGNGIKQSRGWTFLEPREYFDVKDCPHYIQEHDSCNGPGIQVKCPFRNENKSALLWVGKRYYKPETFIKEALEMGMSRRVPTVPKELKLGKTWIFFAHPEAFPAPPGESKRAPGIFYACVAKRIEMPIYESDLTEEVKERLVKRGITPIPIPDGDEDHAKGKKKEVNKL